MPSVRDIFDRELGTGRKVAEDKKLNNMKHLDEVGKDACLDIIAQKYAKAGKELTDFDKEVILEAFEMGTASMALNLLINM